MLTFYLMAMNATGQNVSGWKNKVLTGNNSERLDASWELFKYYRTQNKDSAYFYANINNQTAAVLNDTLSLVKSYNALGYLSRENADYTNAIDKYEKGLALAKEKRYIDQIKFLLNNIAIVYSSYGRYDQSLEYHFQSLKLREEEGDILGISIAYNNIGVVYDKVGDDEKALKYFNLSLKLKEENDLEYDIERSLINISLAYSGLGQFEQALGVLERLFKRCEKEGCSDRIYLETYSSAGLAYLKTNNFIDAELNFKNSLELSESL